MLNIKSIERARDKYAGHKDPAVASRIAVFVPMVLEAARQSAALKGRAVSFEKSELEDALAGSKTLLSIGRLQIEPALFEAGLRQMAEVYVEVTGMDEEMRKVCRDIDWGCYAVPALCKSAATDPMQFMQAIETLSEDEDLLDLVIFPVIGYTLRAFLDETATEAGKAIEALRPDTVHEEQPLRCPVCGCDAAIAAVVGTMHNGNVKKLHCTCCGARWKFERIRCAACGTEAVSDLEYVHDSDDEKRRLHVCKNCGAATPTVFSTDEINFNADVEQIAMAGLEEFYRASLEEQDS